MMAAQPMHIHTEQSTHSPSQETVLIPGPRMSSLPAPGGANIWSQLRQAIPQMKAQECALRDSYLFAGRGPSGPRGDGDSAAGSDAHSVRTAGSQPLSPKALKSAPSRPVVDADSYLPDRGVCRVCVRACVCACVCAGLYVCACVCVCAFDQIASPNGRSSSGCSSVGQ